jgi:biotin carboxyl carrier protein
VAAVTDGSPGRPVRAGREGDGAVRVGLAPTTPDPDVTTLVVGRVDAAGETTVTVDGSPVTLRLDRPAEGGGDLGGDPGPVVVVGDGDPATRTTVRLGPQHRDPRTGVRRREVVVDGWRFEVEIEAEGRAALRERARRGGSEAGHDGPTQVHAIIPGVVVAVSVAVGDPVTVGQQLLVVEAMKMQNELRAPRAGVVGRVAVGDRQTIEVGDLLVVIE